MAERAADPIRLLIVDDDERALEIVAALVGADGRFEIVATATTGEVGIELARVLKPDLVTMDVEMPGMGGVAATKVISETLGIPVVILTASGDADEAVAAGAYAVVSKIDIHTLVPTLLAAVE